MHAHIPTKSTIPIHLGALQLQHVTAREDMAGRAVDSEVNHLLGSSDRCLWRHLQVVHQEEFITSLTP